MGSNTAKPYTPRRGKRTAGKAYWGKKLSDGDRSRHRNWNGYRLKKESWRAKSPEKVENILRSVFAQPKLQDKLSRYSFVTHWHEIVGAKIAMHARPLKVTRGALYVQVENPIWAQELGFLKDSILTRLKKYVSSDTAVSDLRFVVTDSF